MNIPSRHGKNVSNATPTQPYDAWRKIREPENHGKNRLEKLSENLTLPIL